MTETPVILSHNLLKGAVITGDSRENRPPWRIADGLRWTRWEAVSSGAHTLEAVVQNMLANGDFELNADGWFVYVSNGGGGSFSRNTSNPLDGEADLHIEALTAGTSEKLKIINREAFRLKAGRVYRFSFVARSDASRVLRYGFVEGDVNQEPGYSEDAVGTEAVELYYDFTPAGDGVYRPFWRPMEAGDFYVDDAHLCEARIPDTMAIDRGHTLEGYAIEIRKADTCYSGASFVEWKSLFPPACREPVYVVKHDASERGVYWKIDFIPADIAGLPPPGLPLMWIGRRWTLPRNFSGEFDPYSARTAVRAVQGERGIRASTRRFSRRIFEGTLRHLSPSEYAEVEKFMEDTDGGEAPFAFLWRPETNPADMLVMRLEEGERYVPFKGGILREWPFKAVELVGAANTGA